jgi:hypothetical protein
MDFGYLALDKLQSLQASINCLIILVVRGLLKLFNETLEDRFYGFLESHEYLSLQLFFYHLFDLLNLIEGLGCDLCDILLSLLHFKADLRRLGFLLYLLESRRGLESLWRRRRQCSARLRGQLVGEGVSGKWSRHELILTGSSQYVKTLISIFECFMILLHWSRKVTWLYVFHWSIKIHVLHSRI